jgi:pyruvate/2-oxoglutarate dehydrogenase complex dihydrolipoamide acyltransferase (E2) component
MEISLAQYEVMEALQAYVSKKYGCNAPEDAVMGIGSYMKQPVWNKAGDRVIKHNSIPFNEMCSIEWTVAEVE